MDNLVRKRTAEEDVDETVEAETQDHMDHTFTGIMWDVASAYLYYILAALVFNDSSFFKQQRQLAARP